MTIFNRLLLNQAGAFQNVRYIMLMNAMRSVAAVSDGKLGIHALRCSPVPTERAAHPCGGAYRSSRLLLRMAQSCQSF